MLGDIFGWQVKDLCGRHVPGSTGYSACGISHASTMVTQARTGSKTVDLSQALTNTTSFSPSVLFFFVFFLSLFFLRCPSPCFIFCLSRCEWLCRYTSHYNSLPRPNFQSILALSPASLLHLHARPLSLYPLLSLEGVRR